MIAAGIDLGGTKIEVQVFDQNWQIAVRNRIATPSTYDQLVTVLAEQVAWATAQAGKIIPVGIGAPGLINRNTELALTANLPATGRPLPADINQRVGRSVTYINDCRALALSEAVFGAGQDHNTVLSVILGTGVGGGIAVGGALWRGPNDIAGEFGHTPLPAHLVQAHDLPVVKCGCGRMGCVETLISGPGLRRLARAVAGVDIAPPALAQGRADDPRLKQVWNIWCQLLAELLHSLILTVDPDIIVLGGGLSQIEGVARDLQKHLLDIQLAAMRETRIVCAQGGDASGARGAAYAAFQAQNVMPIQSSGD